MLNVKCEEVFEIEISSDHEEAEQFQGWLIARGHGATIGRSTGNYVNGEWTGSSPEANETLNRLWDDYCSQSQPA